MTEKSGLAEVSTVLSLCLSIQILTFTVGRCFFTFIENTVTNGI